MSKYNAKFPLFDIAFASEGKHWHFLCYKYGRLSNHKDCVRGLGLRKINHSVILEDTPSIRGMINKINYLLKVEEV